MSQFACSRPSSRRRAIVGSLLVLVGGLAAAASAAPKSDPSPTTPVAPSFRLPSRGGGVVSLDSLNAKVVLVDFWASWCEPCRKSFPWMRSLQERYGSKGLAIVAVNLDKKREAADSFLEQNPAPFTVAYDPAGTTAEAFRVSGMPSSFLLTPQRKILLTHIGFDPKQTGEVEALIRQTCGP
jgi:cytochrome c biogenesis protein CcmG, thiol:disulfide interchange protein DsbE